MTTLAAPKPIKPPPPPTGGGRIVATLTRTAPWHWLIVLLVCVFVYWTNLGATGLHSTEGHRAIPGWEALETGRWIPTTMFEALYTRKPPGMPWAIALSTMLLGETELAARAPSALACTLMALVACFVSMLWFGKPWGLIAGLTQALMPRFWSSGRSADIEALHCLATQLLALALVQALVIQPRAEARRRIMLSLVIGLSLAATILLKAHAGLPVLVGVVAAACIVRRSPGPVASPALWGGIILTIGLLGPLTLAYLRAISGQPAVSEDFSKFLWDFSRLGEWLLFPLAVLFSALPATLAWLFPWGPDARAEVAGNPNDHAAREIARTLGIAFVVSVGVYMLFGVSNDRYAMPALVVLAPIAAYAARGACTFFTPTRRRIARLMVLGSPVVLFTALLIAAGVFIFRVDPHDARSSARPAGPLLAAMLPDGAEVWADGFVGAKPELLWYARRDAAAAGKRIRPLWKHVEIAGKVPPPPRVFMVLNPTELERYEAAGHGAMLVRVGEGLADKTPWVLVRVAGESQETQASP